MEGAEQLDPEVLALEPLGLRDHQLQAQAHELVAERLRAGQQARVPAQIGNVLEDRVRCAGHVWCLSLMP